MSNLMCITCLTCLEEGTNLTNALTDFLCDVLHFKKKFLQTSSKITCRKCYKTLIDLKCFYTQLRDVEDYFENKYQFNSTPTKLIQEVEETCISQLECTVPMTDDSDYVSKEDPIMIDEKSDTQSKFLMTPVNFRVDNLTPKTNKKVSKVSQKKIVTKLSKQNAANSNVSPKKLISILPKPNIVVGEKRFVCLMCSMMFSSVNELQQHEETHLHSSYRKNSPVFLPTITVAQKRLSGGEDNDQDQGLGKAQPELHRKKRKYEISECRICSKKYLNLTSLEAHMKLKHTRPIDENGANFKENVELPPREE